jgi:hypothetical protein
MVRLLTILAMLALWVAPIQMIGGAAAAMPHHQPAMPQMDMVHCDPAPVSHSDGGDEKRAIDCMIACAGLPALPPSEPEGFAEVRARPAPSELALLHGLAVEAAIPPPRS